MKHRTKNGALRITSINRIFFLRLPIQNHSKLSITNLWWNKAKTSNSNFRKHEFWREKIVKTCRKTEYIISYILSRIGSIKITSNSIRYKFQKICSWKKETKTMLKIKKRQNFFMWFTSRMRKSQVNGIHKISK